MNFYRQQIETARELRRKLRGKVKSSKKVEVGHGNWPTREYRIDLSKVSEIRVVVEKVKSTSGVEWPKHSKVVVKFSDGRSIEVERD